MKSLALRKTVVALGFVGMISFGSTGLASAHTVATPSMEKHRHYPAPNPVPCKLPPGHVCAGR